MVDLNLPADGANNWGTAVRENFVGLNEALETVEGVVAMASDGGAS